MNDKQYRNKLNLRDEENEMFIKTETKTIKIDSQFRLELKEKVMNIMQSKSQKQYFPLDFRLLATAAFVSIAAMFIVQANLGNVFVKSDHLTDTEKRTLLQNVAEKNSLGLFQQNSYAANATLLRGGATGESAMVSDSALPVPAKASSYVLPYNYQLSDAYSYLRQEINYGPQIKACPQYGYDEQIGNTLYESYFYQSVSEGGSDYYSKTVTKTSDGRILDYNLSIGNQVSYQYRGGAYAVKLIYPEAKVATPEVDQKSVPDVNSTESGSVTGAAGTSDSMSPQITPVGLSLEEQIAIMFGNPDSLTIEKMKDAGKTYYVATYNDSFMCGGNPLLYAQRESTQPVSDEKNVITRIWIDPESFEVIRQQSFLTSISPENLISETINHSMTQTVEFSQVAGTFSFDLNTEIETYNIPQFVDYGSDEYYLAIRHFIEQNPALILVPNESLTGIITNWIDLDYTKNDFNYEYLQDRNFYMSGEIGEAQYLLYNGMGGEYVPYIQTLYRVQGGQDRVRVSSDINTVSSFAINIYEPGISTDNLLKSTWGVDYSDYLIENEPITIQIEGNSVTMDMFQVKNDVASVDYGVEPNPEKSSSESIAIPAPDELRGVNRIGIFTYNKYVYLLNIYSSSTIGIQELMQFDFYDLSHLDEQDKFMELFRSIQTPLPVTKDLPVNFSQP